MRQLVCGRRTYQPALDVGTTSPYAHLRQYVVSTTMTQSPDPAVTIIGGDHVAAVQGSGHVVLDYRRA